MLHGRLYLVRQIGPPIKNDLAQKVKFISPLGIAHQLSDAVIQTVARNTIIETEFAVSPITVIVSNIAGITGAKAFTQNADQSCYSCGAG